MVGFIGMFKKAKSGAKLLGSGWKMEQKEFLIGQKI